MKYLIRKIRNIFFKNTTFGTQRLFLNCYLSIFVEIYTQELFALILVSIK